MKDAFKEWERHESRTTLLIVLLCRFNHVPDHHKYSFVILLIINDNDTLLVSLLTQLSLLSFIENTKN